MLRKRDVIVGRYYVNNERKIARQVVQISQQSVTFYTYHLDTGNSCGSPSECLIQDFLRWANREASATEVVSLQQKIGALQYQI